MQHVSLLSCTYMYGTHIHFVWRVCLSALFTKQERERERDVAENEYLNKTDAVCLSTTKCTRGEICRCFFMILYCALPETYLNAYSLGERDSLCLCQASLLLP